MVANPLTAYLVTMALLGTLGFCLIGFIDDYIKLRYPDRRGMTSLPSWCFSPWCPGPWP